MITAPTVSPSSPAVSAADKRVYLPRLWPYRLIGNVLLLILLGFASVGMVIAKNNLVTQKLNSLSDYFYTLTSYLGFTVDDILVYGRNKTAIEEINNIVNTRRGDNILRLDIRQMKSDLEQLPWVKSATVSRSYLPSQNAGYARCGRLTTLFTRSTPTAPSSVPILSLPVRCC